jgi:hypothetical protein
MVMHVTHQEQPRVKQPDAALRIRPHPFGFPDPPVAPALRLGRRQTAVAKYRQFLDRWRDCDEEFRPLLVRAEAALRRLRR